MNETSLGSIKPFDVVDAAITPTSLTCSLYNFQLRTLGWMIYREQTDSSKTVEFEGSEYIMPRGGLLLDEMGLGKTVVLIGLFLSHQLKSAKGTLGGATLVIAPEAILSQWQKELESKAPSLATLVLNSFTSASAMAESSLQGADVVLVGYTVFSRMIHRARPGRSLSRHAKRHSRPRDIFTRIRWWRGFLSLTKKLCWMKCR